MVTKSQILSDFKEYILPCLLEVFSENDIVAKREAWNNYIDSLQKDGVVSKSQANNWSNPF